MACCCNINFEVDVNDCVRELCRMLQLSRSKFDIQELEKEMKNLKGKRDGINDKISHEELEGRIPTNQVNEWLLDVEKLQRQMADIMQDFESTSCFSCNCFHRTGGTSRRTKQEEDITLGKSSNCCCCVISRVAKMLGEANELMSRSLDPIVTDRLRESTVMLSISYQPPVGMKLYVEDIVGYINDRKGKIIGIYGMGGIGKTTLLKSIQQHYLQQHHPTIFHHVIWVVVSENFQLKRLQMTIAKSLNLKTLNESDDEETCGDKLFSFLKNKNCLLLLDDIWSHVNLKALGMATWQGQPLQLRKVVVLTTRSMTVCREMGAKKKIEVKCLNSVEAWQLFQQTSGDGLEGGNKFVAKKLIKECAGLPLALVTVAEAMKRKPGEDWRSILDQIKEKHDWRDIKLSKDEFGMYKAFKLSYDNLENDSIRECLLCCALWLEDYEMENFELIQCWIGCGIINGFDVINEAFSKGCSYLDALLAASLLQQSSRQQSHYRQKNIKMHDVIRDMALLMVSGLEGNQRKWIVKTGIGPRHLLKQKECQEAERASFMRTKITSLQEYEAFTFPKLSMLILHENKNLKTIPPSLFTRMPRLTYLDLTLCDIAELPQEIGSLIDLQYLNLSSNPITILPVEVGCLRKLEYLLLRDTKIQTVPNGTISDLSMLKWLDIKGIYPMPEWWCDELKCFKRCHQLSVAIDIHATTDNIERLNKLPKVSIWELTTDGDDASEPQKLNLGTPQWSYNISDHLESLEIKNVEVARLMLTSGEGDESSFRSLQNLSFYNLQLLEEIPLNGDELCYLRELNISNCPKLKDISWVPQLPCLDILKIEFCPGMEQLISDVGISDSTSSIRSLTLCNMSNLNCIANQTSFSYLEYIHVENCPELKKLPFDAEILKSKLKEIRCDEAWWRDLELDNKNSLNLHFFPIS